MIGNNEPIFNAELSVIRPIRTVIDKDLERASEQEIFDYVAARLLRQGRRSMRDGSCVYRSNTGLKCAVGHCISDALYDAKVAVCVIEGSGATEALETLGIYAQHADLLALLQVIHDSQGLVVGGLVVGEDGEESVDWTEDLSRFAADRGMTFDETRLRHAAFVPYETP